MKTFLETLNPITRKISAISFSLSILLFSLSVFIFSLQKAFASPNHTKQGRDAIMIGLGCDDDYAYYLEEFVFYKSAKSKAKQKVL